MSAGAGGEPGLFVLWAGVVRRRLGWGVGVGALVLLAVTVVLLTAKKVYRAEARLRIGEPPPAAGVSPTGGILSFLRTGGDPFSNDMEVLASRTLTERVVRDVALSAALTAPSGWFRDSIFVSLSVADSTIKATYDLERASSGEMVVRRVAPRDSLVGRFTPGAVARFDGVRAVFREARPGAPGTVTLKTEPLDEAVRITGPRITVERTRREANVIDVSFTSTDPVIAGEVVASVVRHFALLRSQIFQRESGETVDSLRTVARDTEAELLDAERALEEMQRETGLVAAEPQSAALVERFEVAHQALEEARAERALLVAQLERVRAAGDRIDAWSTLVAQPAFLDNPTVGDLLTRLTSLVEERTEAAARRAEGSVDLATIDARIDQLDGALRTLAAEYRQGLDERIGELAARVDQTRALLEEVPGQVVELGRRQRSVRLLSELLILTEQRLRQEELREALSFSTLQVIDPPAVRFRPVWPRRKLGFAVGLLLAGAAGALAMVFVERADLTVRDAAAVRAHTGRPLLLAPVARDGGVLAEPDRVALAGAVEAGASVVACRAAGPAADAVFAALDGPAGAGPADVTDYAGAAALGACGRPVVLVARAGATPRGDLARVAGLLADAGAEVAGTVLLCRDAREAEAAWG